MSNSLQPYGLYIVPWLLCHLDSPGNKTGVDCHALLQGIFLTQGWKLCLLQLLHCKWVLYHWATREAPFCLLFLVNPVLPPIFFEFVEFFELSGNPNLVTILSYYLALIYSFKVPHFCHFKRFRMGKSLAIGVSLPSWSSLLGNMWSLGSKVLTSLWPPGDDLLLIFVLQFF